MRTIGRRVCREIFGATTSDLDRPLKGHVATLRASQAEKAVETLVAADFKTFANLGKAYRRSLGFDARLYDAFHGHSPGTFHGKMALAINPQPSETHLSLPIAAHLSFLTGVNLGRVEKRDSEAARVLIQSCSLESRHGSRRFVGRGMDGDRAVAVV